MIRVAPFALLVCLFAFAPAFAPAAQAVPPTDVATGAATPSESSAEVLGYFNYAYTVPAGIPDSCWFDYGTALAYGSRQNAICAGTTKATLAPLVPGTTYHYRAAASNSDGTTYGPDKTFTTLGSQPPGGAPTATPTAALKIVSGQSLASVLRRGLRMRVTLPGPCPCVVRGNLLLSRRAARRLGIESSTSIALARREYGAPGTVQIALRLKSRAKRKLRPARVLKATARVTVTGPSGKPTVLSRALRLKRGG